MFSRLKRKFVSGESSLTWHFPIFYLFLRPLSGSPFHKIIHFMFITYCMADLIAFLFKYLWLHLAPTKSSKTTISPDFPCQNLKFMLESDQVSSHKKSLKRLTTEKRMTQKFFLTDVELHKVLCLCVLCILHALLVVFDSFLYVSKENY